MRLVPEHPKAALPESLEAIAEADLIVLGPGSLYTSVIPNLLVDGIAEAVALRRRARKVLVMNLMTQEGETEGYTGADHVRALLRHGGPGISSMSVPGQQHAGVRRPCRTSLPGWRTRSSWSCAGRRSKPWGFSVRCRPLLATRPDGPATTRHGPGDGALMDDAADDYAVGGEGWNAMSFASNVKQELCRQAVSRRCCAVAEAFGILLYWQYVHTQSLLESDHGERRFRRAAAQGIP